MPESTELTELYSAIEESARVVGVTGSRDKIWPVLTAYQDTLPQSVISFRVQTGARKTDDLDCRFTLLPKDLDPYAVAVSNGLIAKTDHPVGALLREVHDEFPVDCYGVDFGVVGGFKKAWSFFRPDDLQSVSRFAGLPSMPPSVSENLHLFDRYGMTDTVSVVGYDYTKRSINLYFTGAPAECFTPEGIKSVLSDFGMPEPSDGMLKFGEQAFAIYVTLNWDSLQAERVTYSVNTRDAMALPVDIAPPIEKLVKDGPYGTAGSRFVYGITVTPKGEYHKIQKYYQWQTRVEKLLSADAG
ncbi:prenyltransferase [Streptomyces tuirus]|uniref:Prenyltransferase n=1 Tax=Streptomyces tuirus TaxID=68278 RepID=A0A941FDR7_9ACTN|nr:prenyltransferase [Streptomyces tuirus]